MLGRIHCETRRIPDCDREDAKDRCKVTQIGHDTGTQKCVPIGINGKINGLLDYLEGRLRACETNTKRLEGIVAKLSYKKLPYQPSEDERAVNRDLQYYNTHELRSAPFPDGVMRVSIV